jgi:hypothetical protein
MQKEYEIPELTLVGQADDVVMGTGMGTEDAGMETAPDFAFGED